MCTIESMVRWSLVAAVVATSVLGEGEARACPPRPFYWTAPDEVGPGATVYGLPTMFGAYGRRSMWCRSRFIARDSKAIKDLVAGERWPGVLRVVGHEGPRPVFGIVEPRQVGACDLLAVTLLLDSQRPVRLNDLWYIDATARPLRVVPTPRPSWSFASATVGADDGDVRLALRGTNVGYWVVETRGCLDQLVRPEAPRFVPAFVPPGELPEVTSRVTAEVDVPASCVAGGAVHVSAAYFDGTSDRQRALFAEADDDGATRVGALVLSALGVVHLRRRRARVVPVP